MTKEITKENKFLKGIPKSRAKKIREALQMQKGLIKRKQKLTDFKEPLAMLTRRDNTVEFYEKATRGVFDFTHTNGDVRRIELTPSRLLHFPYGDRRVRLYFLHEDYPLPLPESDPAVSSELIAISQEKSMHDINKFRVKEAIANAGKTWKLLLGIAIVIGAIGLVMTVIPSHIWDKVFGSGAKATANAVKENASATPLLGAIIPFIKRKWLNIKV